MGLLCLYRPMSSLPDLVFEPFSLLAGIALGGLIVFLIFLPSVMQQRRQGKQLGLVFDSLAQDALRKSSEQFLQLAQEKLKQAQMEGGADLDKRQKAISDIIDPIAKALNAMDGKIENLGKTGASLETHLKTFADDQRLLREQTQNLVSALRNPHARGRWGEMQLQRAFEIVGLIEGTHFLQQKSVSAEHGSQKPDFIVKMPGGMEIVIDVKTPLDPYWQWLDHAVDEASRDQALQQFRGHIRNHVKALGSKEYWRQFESPEFVVMFLPSEGLYALAVSNDTALLEEAAKHNIILASPTTVMGLLRVIMHGWQQQKLADEARSVAQIASELYRRISIFGDHMGKLGKNLSTAVGAYNAAVGSLEGSILPQARKMKEYHIPTGGKEVSLLPAIDESPRTITAPELNANPKEAA